MSVLGQNTLFSCWCPTHQRVSPLSNEETDKGNNPQTIAKKENANSQLLLGWIQ